MGIWFCEDWISYIALVIRDIPFIVKCVKSSWEKVCFRKMDRWRFIIRMNQHLWDQRNPAESSGSRPRYAVMMCTMTLGFWSAIVKICQNIHMCAHSPPFCWLPLLLGWRVVTIIVLTQNFTSWLCCHGNFLTNYPPTFPDPSHSA